MTKIGSSKGVDDSHWKGRIQDLPDYPAIEEIAAALWGTREIRGAAVMIGAGFSRFAEFPADDTPLPPLWNDFRHSMAAALYAADPGKAPTNPLRLAEEYRAMRGPVATEALVRSLVKDGQWHPSATHRSLLRLPWTDVLTTNWDTLLERTVDPDAERIYEAVLTAGDIARTRSPRIVKLHGTFPSLSPFIFTEEDYRTYPTNFAAFVNLAQQVLLENELCLLGFSGDDPNFLAWSGWVRDHLRNQARKIHLVGVLDLSPSQRRMLEQRNVSIIDLAPLVHDRDVGDRHRVAAEQFLAALHASKPVPPWVWNRRDDLPNEEPLDQLADRWREEREQYPGWLVAPYAERYRLRLDTHHHLGRIMSSEILAQLRQSLFLEAVWRCEIGLAGLPDALVPRLQALLDEAPTQLSKKDRFDLIIAISAYHRERRDQASFDSSLDNAVEVATTDERRARIAYERCQWARDRIDFCILATIANTVRGNDPVWTLRRAQMLCHLGRTNDAANAIRNAHTELKHRHLRDRNSLWVLSRLAWAQFMVRSLGMELTDENSESHFTDWPQKYAEAKCDPWTEIQNLRVHIDEEATENRDSPEQEVALFDPGSRRIAGAGGRFVSGSVIKPWDELHRFVDAVGFTEFPSYNTFGTSFEKAAKLLEGPEPVLVWAKVLATRSYEGFIDACFGRIDIALLDVDLVHDITDRLTSAIDYCRAHFKKGEPDGDGNRRADVWMIHRVRCHLQLLSRLAVRVAPTKAEELFRWGLNLAHQPDWKHWWLFEHHGHLLDRALTAIPPNQKANLTLDILNLPLVGEKDTQGIDHHWPDLGEHLIEVAALIRRPTASWDARVAQLIQRVRSPNRHDRTKSLIRLLALIRANALLDHEKGDLADAIWSMPNTPLLLPGGSELLPHAWLELLNDQRACDAFQHDVIDSLRSGQLTAPNLRALRAIADTAYRGPTVIIEKEAALDIANRIVDWRPSRNQSFDLVTQRDDELAQLSAWALAESIFPALSNVAFSHEFCENFFEASRTGVHPHLAIAASYIAIHGPDQNESALRLIRRAMVARDRDIAALGVHGVRIWAALARSGELHFPSILASDVANLCSARHDASLYFALYVSRDLLGHGQMTADGIERMEQALDLLVADTAYENQANGRLSAVTLTLVRSEAVKLAHLLVAKGYDSEAAQNWIAMAPTDPLPEVRLAMYGACDT